MNYSSVGNWISYYRKDVVALCNCQIDLKYSHQLIAIPERRFSGYLYDDDGAEKKGKKTQPPIYKGLRALRVHTVSETLIKLMFIYKAKSESQPSKYCSFKPVGLCIL